jgi:hypothetical protein
MAAAYRVAGLKGNTAYLTLTRVDLSPATAANQRLDDGWNAVGRGVNGGTYTPKFSRETLIRSLGAFVRV